MLPASGAGGPAPQPSSTPADIRAAPVPGDRVLAAERDHLRQSQECLRLMRENVLGLRAMAGDPVSQEYLKADLHRRAEALREIPDVPLFFGRLDYAKDSVADEEVTAAGPGGQRRTDAAGDGGGGPGGQALPGERLHIGRRHIHDSEGHPVVIDWRAPVSRPFYRASAAEPMGLARRRRFGFSGADLTAYEDEELGAGGGAAGALSTIMLAEIERPRSGPMRDIVATIQPDQDDIVRAGADRTVCVQGAPGTGKTAVGLHRVAYLLYAHSGRMLRGGVLVIGPNRAFLSYIRGVLPALGEGGVAQLTIPDLVGTVPVRATDSTLAAQVKGDARMAQVLHRALWAGLAEPAEALVLSRGSWRWRVPGYEITELIAELRERGVRYGAGRAMLGHRIAHVILTRMEAAGEAADDRTHEAVRRTRQVRATVDAAWPAADPVRLVMRLLSDPAVLASAADGMLDPAEQAAIRWEAPPRGPGTARWSAADAVLIDEASDLIERTPSLAHVVVDEAQDLSPMECRAVGRRCATGSATVLGDLAQATAPAAVASWPLLLDHLGKPGAGVQELETGYRVPRQILDFASTLLPALAPGLAPARSLRQDPGSLTITRVAAGELAGSLAVACAQALSRPGSAAVIASDEQVAALHRALAGAGIGHEVLDGATSDGRLTLVPVTLAKGLEFDHVIVVEPARIAAQPRGLHRLYVGLTRAVSRLTVLHTLPLPEPLRAGAGD
ncbi:MAG TPA: ATP-binding domain-containing protein [Streptosporangiaceae bacterium]|nr:ATP-binding domain-containing protein [Streptosporangiaceae bacterium]